MFFSLASFGYHIKSKHDVSADGTEQKCFFSPMSVWDSKTHLQRKGLPFHCNTVRYAVSFTLSYAIFDVLISQMA